MLWQGLPCSLLRQAKRNRQSFAYGLALLMLLDLTPLVARA